MASGEDYGIDHSDFFLQPNQTEAEACRRKAELSQPEGFCSDFWDGILCWPQTSPGTTAILKCFEVLEGVTYDSTREYFCWGVVVVGCFL